MCVLVGFIITYNFVALIGVGVFVALMTFPRARLYAHTQVTSTLMLVPTRYATVTSLWIMWLSCDLMFYRRGIAKGMNILQSWIILVSAYKQPPYTMYPSETIIIFCHWSSIVSEHTHNWSFIIVTLIHIYKAQSFGLTPYSLIWQFVRPYLIVVWQTWYLTWQMSDDRLL